MKSISLTHYNLITMQKIIILLCFTFLTTYSNAQSVWAPSLLKSANTGEKINYLTATEKEVIYYINLVRSNPALFEKTYLKKFLDSAKINNNFTKTLIKTLKETKALPLLEPSKVLFDEAKSHAVKFGKSGKIGHDNFADRMKSIKGQFGDLVAENCDYGNSNALDIVISLLIDEGDSNFGHRKNILDPNFKFIGVSIQPHKKYEWNCVMDFGGVKK